MPLDDTLNHVERRFMAGELGYMQAIEELERVGMQPYEAETHVYTWSDSTPKSKSEE